MESSSLDADQRYQARRHAALKRWVIEHVHVLEPGELARLIPDRVGRATNTGRVVERLRKRNELPALPCKSGWRYPAAQIDGRGRVHAPLPRLIARATAQDYEPWEIVYWLARPTEVHAPPVVGRAPEPARRYESLDDMWQAAVEDAPPQPPPTWGPSPFTLLAAGELDRFAEVATAWLGPVTDSP